MEGIRLILAVHNHQPVGNFDGVFEAAYRESYEPFLDVLEGYPSIPFVVHTSGPLLEWLVENRPEYVARLRAMAAAGRVEILGGPFYEPILTMIPRVDVVGQIRSYADFLEEHLGVRPRGAWIPERVWEQQLVGPLTEGGVEYTLLDDFHFQPTGVPETALFDYYLTEHEGRLLKVFPNCERLRYLIPFQAPHESYLYLQELARTQPGCTVICGDDGEKFGSWPETYKHVYEDGWLRHFCDMLVANSSWVETTTFAKAVDSTLPRGKVYLPDASYREMCEWVLPPDRFVQYKMALSAAKDDPAAALLRPFVRPGGYWRNFKAKYPETDEMYTRMLGISRRLEKLPASADPDYRELARQELYRGQCNCPYWHGSFGGLYLPHLRNAIYRHLIAAEAALDDAEELPSPRVSAEAADFNLDARQEVRLDNDRLTAFVRPARGGHIYELDVRHAQVNVLATLQRRPEAYHAAIAVAASTRDPADPSPESSPVVERVVLKHEGLDQLLVMDRHPRKALVDHFLTEDCTLEQLATCQDVERGDFVEGAYLSTMQRLDQRVELTMQRPGLADGHLIRVRKVVSLAAGKPGLEIRYTLEDLPADKPLHFAVEFNLAAMAGHAPDRYYSRPNGERLGMLDERLDLRETDGLNLTDEWLDLAIQLSWSRRASLYCFPVETVSQSEGGFEAVYQGSVVLPRWRVTPDAERRWEVTIGWTLEPYHPVLRDSRINLAQSRPSPVS